MPKRKQQREAPAQEEGSAAPARSLWSGTITFGLVSIPVDLLTGIRPRQTGMKLVDESGHALGRRYHCSKEGRKLDADEIVRGYETDDGKMVVITDEEFDSVAPEMSGDIEIRNFVPLAQIPPLYFQRPYFLAPAGRSVKAYNLLAATMEKTSRVGVGSFVMRGHEYLVAIVSDNGVLRADTLRYADEIRGPETIGLPKRTKVAAARVNRFSKAIGELTRTELDMSELEDEDAEALRRVVEAKEKQHRDVIHTRGLEEEDSEASAEGAKVIDLMAVLRKSLSKNAVVTTAQGSPPISLAERRAQRDAKAAAAKSSTGRKRRAKSQSKGRRKRAQRA